MTGSLYWLVADFAVPVVRSLLAISVVLTGIGTGMPNPEVEQTMDDAGGEESACLRQLFEGEQPPSQRVNYSLGPRADSQFAEGVT